MTGKKFNRRNAAGVVAGLGAALLTNANAAEEFQQSVISDMVEELAKRERAVRLPAMRFIPIRFWAALQAGTETADMSAYLMRAISEASNTNGAIVMLPQWTMCISQTLTWNARGVGLDGGVPKWGVTESNATGCCLKWTGSKGGPMVKVNHGGHHALIQNIAFDANDRADTCVGFITDGGAKTQTLFRPILRNCQFNGYRGPAVVVGNPDTNILETGQLQTCGLYDLCWTGGGPTATTANVFGLVINAQNCEIAVANNLYFDPYTEVGGGRNKNHQSHIKIRAGGFNLTGGLFTRASGYDIDVVGECGLVVSHCRTEDPLFLRMAEAFSSNPVHIANVQGRSGNAKGTEVFMDIRTGGNIAIIENIWASGSIRFGGASPNSSAITRNIKFIPGTAATGSIQFTSQPSGKYDIGTDPGIRSIHNSSAMEEWKDSSGQRLYRNDRGRIRIRSLQTVSAAVDAVNFGGSTQILGARSVGAVRFSKPEPDENYLIGGIFCFRQSTGASKNSGTVLPNIERTVHGFNFKIAEPPGEGESVEFSWWIFRA